MAKKLYVGNLTYNTTSAQVQDLFAAIGKVATCSLITDKYSGTSKGFAFVEMETEEDAQKAIKELNGKDVDGRAIVVNEARPQEKRDNYGSGGRDNYRKDNNRW